MTPDLTEAQISYLCAHNIASRSGIANPTAAQLDAIAGTTTHAAACLAVTTRMLGRALLLTITDMHRRLRHGDHALARRIRQRRAADNGIRLTIEEVEVSIGYDPAGKAADLVALREELGLPEADEPTR